MNLKVKHKRRSTLLLDENDKYDPGQNNFQKRKLLAQEEKNKIIEKI